MMGVSLRAYARIRGCSLTAVQKAISSKRITALVVDDLAAKNTRTFTGELFIDASYEGDLMAGARDVVLRTINTSNPEEMSDWSVIKEKIRVDLKRYINKQTSKRPLILPVILEV